MLIRLKAVYRQSVSETGGMFWFFHIMNFLLFECCPFDPLLPKGYFMLFPFLLPLSTRVTLNDIE